MADLDEQRRALGRAIAEHRDQQHLSRAEAARRWRVSPSWLAHIERGEANPPFTRLTNLAVAMGLTPSELFRRGEEVAAAPVNPPVPPARRR